MLDWRPDVLQSKIAFGRECHWQIFTTKAARMRQGAEPEGGPPSCLRGSGDSFARLAPATPLRPNAATLLIDRSTGYEPRYKARREAASRRHQPCRDRGRRHRR